MTASGRPPRGHDPVTNVLRLGRFGWKAGQANVKYQVAGALRTDIVCDDLRLSTPTAAPRKPTAAPPPGDGRHRARHLTAYVSLLGIRPQRDWANADVIKGKELFTSTGCANCHTPSFETTQYHPHAELRSQKVQPYTDLLLHDMGPGLADNLPEGEASGAEWRTTPLWSIGLSGERGNGAISRRPPRKLAEAILARRG